MTKGNRRCYYFDSDGEPINGGCPRRASVCDFYHPDEQGWITAKIPFQRGNNKNRHTRARSATPPSSGYRRDSSFSRNRQKRHSHSRSPARRTRHDSMASNRPGSGPPQNPRVSGTHRASLTDMSPNIASSQPQQASSSSSLINSTPSLPTRPVTGFGDAPFHLQNRRLSSMMISSMNVPISPKAMRSVVRSVHPRSSLRTNSHPPPKVHEPMPPPQPLPAVPPALSAKVESPTPVQPTAEQKRAMWEERTRIFSEAELAHEQLAALEEQHAYALQIVQGRFFDSQPEEDKIRLKSQLAELENQRDEAKKLHEEMVDKLFKTDSWPIAPPSSIEDGVEEKYNEVLKYIQELKDTALQMSRTLGDISMFKPPTPLFLADESDGEDGAVMDVDRAEGAHRKSLKRRRISENLDRRGSGSIPSMPTQEELDEFLDRLANMEGLISTLENDINQHGREARAEFEQLVDAKLDEFQVAREEEERQRLEEEQQQIQFLEQDNKLTGEQMGELATEIADLIIRVGKLEVDVGASRKGRQESFEKVLEVERRLQEYISTRDANVHAIQTFEKALNAYTSRPPSPPATPLNQVPSFDYIFQSLEEPMVQSLRLYLAPAIEDLRKDVENMVRTQNAELYSTLWNKITVTLKVLDMIQSKMSLGDIDVEPGECFG